MPPARRIATAIAAAVLGVMFTPGAARAQWYFASFTGGNFTRDGTVVVDQPGLDRHLEFAGVPFKAEPLKSPLYYGGRLGFLFAGGRLGIEGEFLHIKVTAETETTVHVTGRDAGQPIDLVIPMNQIVQRYEMTHGLNFWMANLVWREPLSSRVALVFRGGAGPVTPGVDTIVDHQRVDHYEYAGIGGQGSAGVDIRVARVFSVTAEYKLTFARPRIDVHGGEGQTTALSHHVAAGFAIGFSR